MSAPCYIYFLRATSGAGPIKVGYSTNPEKRLIDYGKWSPIPLEIVAKFDVPPSGNRYGDYFGREWELRFHARYADHRMHHEWFAPHPELLTDIERLKGGTFDLDCLPLLGKSFSRIAA